MDQETQKVYSEGESISDYIKSKGWGIVKEIFTNKILDLESVRNIKRGSVEEIANEVLARTAASDILKELITDIEGLGQQHDSNRELMSDNKIQIINN